jgi:hypothetical protein
MEAVAVGLQQILIGLNMKISKRAWAHAQALLLWCKVLKSKCILD